MYKLQSKPVAWAIVGVVICLVTWWAASQSIFEARYQIQRIYYQKDSSYIGIENSLEEIRAASASLIPVAERYAEPGNPLVADVNQLIQRQEQDRQEYGYEKEAATASELHKALQNLREYLNALEMEEADRLYLQKQFDSLESNFAAIQGSPYNEKARAFNRQLGRFPTNLIADANYIYPLALYEW